MGGAGRFALVVAVLALGKPVFVPLALAFYLAFVLTPPSEKLEQLGAPRALSVVAVVGTALAGIGVLGALVISQAADFSRQLKTYSSQTSAKLSALHAGGTGAFSDLSAAWAELGQALEPALGSSAPVTPVRLVSGGQSGVQRLLENLSPLLTLAGLTLIVFVMAVFMLGHREDLRGRLIRLMGPENVTVTTRTMAEAVKRVSHLLLTQAYINLGFGVVIGSGLSVIGVPYALLWGAIGGFLRFIPIVGVLVATTLPAAVAFAVFPGWHESVFVVALCLSVELTLSNFIEPTVLGRRTGVSALALLVSTVFWTWLWGPPGLIIATPLTICAAVIGRHVPGLSFLAVILGDEAGLDAEVNFYQRTLAGAMKDAYRLAKRRVSETSLAAMFDELLVPALGLMVHDLHLRAIDEAEAERVIREEGNIVARLRPPAAQAAPKPSVRVLGIPAESSADDLLLDMLQVTMREQSGEVAPVKGVDRTKALAVATEEPASVVCIAALPPSGNSNARFLCRQLRAKLPDAYILVLSPETATTRSPEAAARLREAGANSAVSSIREATRLLMEQRA